MTLFLFLALTIASFAGIIMASKSGKFILIAVCLVLVILPWIALFILLKRSPLKWETDGLVFTVMEDGIHVTSPNNYRISLFAEWAKIAGYSIKQGKNGKSNVIVNFNCPVYGSIWGKVNYLKMSGVMGADELHSVFEKFGINNMELSKN